MAASTKTTEQASEESPGLHGMYRELWGLEKGGSWSGGGVGVGACSKCQSHRAGGYRGCRTPHSGHQIKKEGKGSLGSVHLGSIQNLLTQKIRERICHSAADPSAAASSFPRKLGNKLPATLLSSSLPAATAQERASASSSQLLIGSCLSREDHVHWAKPLLTLG